MQRSSLFLSSLVVVAVTTPSGFARGEDFVYAGETTPAPSTPTTPTAPEPPVDAFVQKGGYDLELGARAGYATAPIRGGINPFGAGFGGRLGFAIGGFYGGVTIVDFVGGTDVDLSDSALLYGVELGYGFRYRVFSYGALTIRPQLGVGNATFFHTDPSQRKVDVVTTASGSSSRSSDTTTVNNIYVEPALLVMLASGRHFAAIDASIIVVPGISYGEPESSTWLSYSLQGHIGFRF